MIEVNLYNQEREVNSFRTYDFDMYIVEFVSTAHFKPLCDTAFDGNISQALEMKMRTIRRFTFVSFLVEARGLLCKIFIAQPSLINLTSLNQFDQTLTPGFHGA